MSLIHNKSEKYKKCNFDSQLKRIISNHRNIKEDNKSIILDITYKLFTHNNKDKDKNKNKIKIIETPFINNYKYRNKKIDIKLHTDFNIKKFHNLKEKKAKSNSELMKKNKINKINSIIININNSQYNKTNNSSFRKKANSNTKEKNKDNKNKNRNDDYFYDFTMKNKQINYFNLYYTNIYKNKNKTNYHKIKLDKNYIRDKLNFGESFKKPIKIKTNIIDSKIKKRKYIKKNNSEKLYSKSINKESNNNNTLLNSLNTINNIYKYKNILNSTQKKNKTAENNYIEKWQLINGVNVEKKYSLSNIHSKKNLKKIPKNLGKNISFSYRKYNKTDKNYNIKMKNENINTEINEDYNLIDDYECNLLNNKKWKKGSEKKIYLENKMKSNKNNNNINNNDNSFNISNVAENENEEVYNDNLINNKKDLIENLNAIIERKKREIDLLNVMKFTSKIYNSNKEIDNLNYNNDKNDKNKNYNNNNQNMNNNENENDYNNKFLNNKLLNITLYSLSL